MKGREPMQKQVAPGLPSPAELPQPSRCPRTARGGGRALPVPWEPRPPPGPPLRAPRGDSLAWVPRNRWFTPPIASREPRAWRIRGEGGKKSSSLNFVLPERLFAMSTEPGTPPPTRAGSCRPLGRDGRRGDGDGLPGTCRGKGREGKAGRAGSSLSSPPAPYVTGRPAGSRLLLLAPGAPVTACRPLGQPRIPLPH